MAKRYDRPSLWLHHDMTLHDSNSNITVNHCKVIGYKISNNLWGSRHASCSQHTVPLPWPQDPLSCWLIYVPEQQCDLPESKGKLKTKLKCLFRLASYINKIFPDDQLHHFEAQFGDHYIGFCLHLPWYWRRSPKYWNFVSSRRY